MPIQAGLERARFDFNFGALVASAKRWFVRFRVEVWSLDGGEGCSARPVLAHDFDAPARVLASARQEVAERASKAVAPRLVNSRRFCSQ